MAICVFVLFFLANIRSFREAQGLSEKMPPLRPEASGTRTAERRLGRRLDRSDFKSEISLVRLEKLQFWSFTAGQIMTGPIRRKRWELWASSALTKTGSC